MMNKQQSGITTIKDSISDRLHINTTEKCQKSINNFKKKFHVDSTCWLYFLTYNLSRKTKFNNVNSNSINQLLNTIWDKKSMNNNRLKHYNAYKQRLWFMDVVGSPLMRMAGGGPGKKKKCGDRCVYANRAPFDYLLDKKEKKPKKITIQRSDTCCQNWKKNCESTTATADLEKKCSKDSCTLCKKRKLSKNRNKEYFSDCLKDHDKNSGLSECQKSWAEKQCDCGKKCDDLSVLCTMKKRSTCNIVELENFIDDSCESCDICLKNKAVESYQIKKGDIEGPIRLCAGCAKKVDTNVKEYSIRITAGGLDKNEEIINCEEGKCLKDCKKYKVVKAAKSNVGRTKPCCPNCSQKFEVESAVPVEEGGVNTKIENPCRSHGKKNSYCCNYNKKKKVPKEQTVDVCDNEKCPKQKRYVKPKDCDEETKHAKTLCECPKGCNCLCSKYAFFETTNKPEPIEITCEEKTIEQVTTDCEDPQVNAMIEELKSEVGCLLKKLEVLGKSQCKCSVKREELVCFATQIVNNPFDTSNKLSRYIDVNDDALNKNENINDNLEKNTNTTFIMTPKQINEVETFSAPVLTSKSNIQQTESKNSDTDLQENDSSLIEKLPKKLDLCDRHRIEEFGDFDKEEKMEDLLSKELIKKLSDEIESSILNEHYIGKMENNIDIISAKVIKDSNNKKQKLLLHLHMKRGKK